ncbi:hypothetical protein ACFQRL_11100 [Microbacterium fluvii]|uniref:Uncharacterized protein n=1 Tax=Microbacterium fluvii TaxID=415215 RepID=A0ABW2HHL0_9MICO|nr:YncE family protein [Microbacterium fluvii]MCU4673141.1 YncE family protein [Microbacterium fluvii]
MNTTLRRRGRITAIAVTCAVGLTALTAVPASADTGTWLNGGATGATVGVADAVIVGDSIRLEGSGWTDGTDDSDADGSWIAVKLGAAGGVEADVLTTEPAAGKFVFPGAGSGTAAIWSGIVADDDGDFSVDIPFPTATNTSPALATAWAVGTTHHLQLLTGSMKAGGDVPRSVYVTFTVTGDTLAVTSGAGGRGAAAGTVVLTFAGAAGTFAANEALTAKVDGVDTAWTTGGTASATGALTSTTISYAPGALRAGVHEVAITGATTGTKTRTVTVLPTASYSSLTQASTGTLTLSNLPSGSSVAGVSFDGAPGITFSGLPATETDGVATASYSIPADTTLGTYPVTVTLANPAATFTLAGQKISPDATIFGDDAFTLTSNGTGIFQGLYQSAYSAEQDALYAAAASGTGTAEDGYLYKLDPDTLEVLASVHPKEVTDSNSVAGQAPYGVGVDDVNGTVWVSNTRTNSLAVYDADDLTLLKQFPSGTISHSRDLAYDPISDRVFVSSASEGTTGNGYISVFDGETFEKIQDIPTGARTEFSPVSVEIVDGVLYSPSLSSNKVAKIDTTTLEVTFLEISGINVGGRGASGIDYDADSDRLYIASQNGDELVIADATTGETLKEVPTGTGALNVEIDDVNDLVYVTNLSGGTVTVLDLDGTKVANLPIVRANHVTTDGAGTAYVVDKNTGNKVWKVTVNPDVASSTPTITGSAKVGSKLTASAGDWSEGATLAYQWNRDGVAISGATASTYTATAADAGKALSVTVTGSLEGHVTVSKTSAATAKVAAGTLASATPKISGTAKVGKTLTAAAGTWTSGTSLSYAWYADGKAISGKTAKTLVPSSSLVGKKITVKVTGKKSGYTTVTKTSAATAKVAKGTLATATPKIKGTAKAGKKLTVSAGTWTSGTKLSYQWYADGKKIKGKTGKSLTLTNSLVGDKITVKVTGTKSGYTTVTKTSKSTSKVAKR